jgi:menaquinone-dependent protoporphyrinogen IX oxidase
MFFILTLLNTIKEDKKVREENYEIIREINDFLSLYSQQSEKTIEEALKARRELKEFVDAYLLNLSTKEIAALIAQTESAQKNKQQTQTKQHAKKPPYNNNKGLNIERSM